MLTDLKNAFVSALDAYYDAYMEEPSSVSALRRTEINLQGKDRTRAPSNITCAQTSYVDTAIVRSTIPRGSHVSLMRLNNGLDSHSETIIPKGDHDALLELLSLFKYSSEHHKTRKQKLTTLDDMQHRLNILQIDVNNAQHRVSNSSLETKKGMMKTLERHSEVLEAARKRAEDQRAKFLRSEQKLTDIRDAMIDSIALERGVTARLPLHLSRLGRDLLAKDLALSAEATKVISEDVGEIFQALESQRDNDTAEHAQLQKLQQDDLLESLDICRNEMDTSRTIIDNTKKVEHAQNREQSLKQLRLHQEQLINRMRALADELIIRGVPCSLDGEFDDWLEEFGEVDAQAEIKPNVLETSLQSSEQSQTLKNLETRLASTEAEDEGEDDNDIESDASDIVDEISEQRRNSEVGSPRSKA
ncbi:hypothetical protein PMZ80_002534 [Knufia obscura]|uniref:Uncharacterized protein n=1 Tax=Knufia obscura TaxID=1635080 RepID=A0ABR0RXL6_9EURO|nr:hypothetical protein PMZ80_002534 [Knufia obscura]